VLGLSGERGSPLGGFLVMTEADIRAHARFLKAPS
jgi:hypothetical protein